MIMITIFCNKFLNKCYAFKYTRLNYLKNKGDGDLL